MRVLVVEKDNTTKTIYQSELYQQNITVDLASNGEEGLKMASENKPDLILLELVSPRINGFDFLAKIKKDKILKDVKVLVASILSQKKDIDEALALGAYKYLQKDSYSQKQIIATVLEALMEE
ncbi:response regulator [Candidatus Parcubacteria bacterium]|nr:response regulator [Patescibacteria group bacterium]MBU4309380.1 response regulator [Patescibacteria group bacterium]MBU4432091.1 response regulator [Patescibacteria group bacterium]MBU4577741.1 response regulator [Patescibacteria group bacterium]MCG2697426.1 response regulator [Candidatus Parcubacteria bacterium]